MVADVVQKPLCQFISVLGREPENQKATVMGDAGMDLFDHRRSRVGTYEPHDEVCFLYLTEIGVRGGFGTCGSAFKEPWACNW